MVAVIAIFDIGKTNKKFFLFDEQYKIVVEKTETFAEIVDDDGDACENVQALTTWVISTLSSVIKENKFSIKALNFSTYGASFVYINKDQSIALPLYNYLKSYPAALQQKFYEAYGSSADIALQTASPVLGHLNSGMQLYWLKHQKPTAFNQVATALHLPQYLSYLFTHHTAADLTSIGCHTQLWNFQTQQYHNWVRQEKIDSILPPITSATSTRSVNLENTQMQVGIGLHDSSAALIPYLTAFSVPFILISTGTWCISLHPFNNNPLTPHELENDCLFFMGYHGKPVKAARLFAGHEHEVQTKRIANHFNVATDFYTSVVYDKSYIDFKLLSSTQNVPVGVHGSGFEHIDLSDFKNEQHAYHALITQLMVQQKTSTSLVLGPTKVQRIFVDGGFGKNTIYMNLLAAAFPNIEVYAASVAQATAVGAALAIHESWNTKSIPNDMIELKFYTTL